MRNIFLNNEVNSEFNENGFVLLRNFLNEAEVQKLIDTFLPPAEKITTMLLTNLSEDEEYKKTVHNEIINVVLPVANRYIENYFPVHGIFSCKPEGENSKMCFHRDWGLVDENEFTSLSIWILLTNSNKNNGVLDLLPFSHKYDISPRGRNFPFEEFLSVDSKSCLTKLNLDIGDAIVFNHRVIHGSSANSGDSPRLAAVLALIPEEAKLVHYYGVTENPKEVELLELDRTTFYSNNFKETKLRPRHIRVIKKYDIE